eukprot:g899.t1
MLLTVEDTKQGCGKEDFYKNYLDVSGTIHREREQRLADERRQHDAIVKRLDRRKEQRSKRAHEKEKYRREHENDYQKGEKFCEILNDEPEKDDEEGTLGNESKTEGNDDDEQKGRNVYRTNVERLKNLSNRTLEKSFDDFLRLDPEGDNDSKLQDEQIGNHVRSTNSNSDQSHDEDNAEAMNNTSEEVSGEDVANDPENSKKSSNNVSGK